MRQFLMLFFLFFSTTIYADIITFDEFTGTTPYYGTYSEDGISVERRQDHIPLFIYSGGNLSFSETNGPFPAPDGSFADFRMEGGTFDLLSLDITSTHSDVYIVVNANGQSLIFNSWGPPSEEIIRPTIGTHSLADYDFLQNISEFTIIGTGTFCTLDNISFQTSSVPETSISGMMFCVLLLFACVIVKKQVFSN